MNHETARAPASAAVIQTSVRLCIETPEMTANNDNGTEHSGVILCCTSHRAVSGTPSSHASRHGLARLEHGVVHGKDTRWWDAISGSPQPDGHGCSAGHQGRLPSAVRPDTLIRGDYRQQFGLTIFRHQLCSHIARWLTSGPAQHQDNFSATLANSSRFSLFAADNGSFQRLPTMLRVQIRYKLSEIKLV